MKKVNRLPICQIVCIILLFTNCNSATSVQKKLIAGLDYKLWKRSDEAERLRKTITYFYFNREGKFQIYKRYKNSETIEKLNMGDVVLIEEWKLINENEISIAGQSYQIIRLNDTCFSFRDTTQKKEITTLVYKNDRLP